MLIARVDLVLALFKIQVHQSGHPGNIINFPQDVNEVARKHPQLPIELSQNIVVVKQTAVRIMSELDVNSQARSAWSLWLTQNNRYYGDIEFSEAHLTASAFLWYSPS